MSLYIEITNDHISVVLLPQTLVANRHLIRSPAPAVASNSISIAGDEGDSEQAELSIPRTTPMEVDRILADYQRDYAPDQERHIVASMQGEPSIAPITKSSLPSHQQLYLSNNLKPRSTAYFRVMDLTLDEVILIVIHSSTRDFICQRSWNSLSFIDKDYNHLLKEVICLDDLDFSEIS